MTNAKAQMIKIDVVAGFIPALLMGTMRAGTRLAPTTEINNYLVLGICLAKQGAASRCPLVTIGNRVLCHCYNARLAHIYLVPLWRQAPGT